MEFLSFTYTASCAYEREVDTPFWKKGSEYVKYARQMINKGKKSQNEYYVAPVYNEAIEDNKVIKTFEVDKMWGLGTSEDLDYFISHYDVEKL